MWFIAPIKLRRLHGTGFDYVYVPVELTVLGGRGRGGRKDFRFDTGCVITTVSEDVATALGLPVGGTPITVGGSTGRAPGRLVPVRFQFPTSPSGPGLVVDSMWVVVTGPRSVALLGFQEVHQHFQVRSEPFEMWFVPWRRTAVP